MLDDNLAGKHQEVLHNLLREFALSNNELWKQGMDLTTYVNRLYNVYTGNFYPQYSKLLDVVNSVFYDDDKDITVFQENMKTFRLFLESHHTGCVNDELVKNFDRLRDHILLEISRRQTMLNQNQKLHELEEHHEAIRGRANELANELDQKFLDISARLSKVQTDFVAILSIFACVITAFSSGSNYMISAITSASQNFTIEVLLVVLICGLVMMNTLFILVYFIGGIIGRNLGLKWWVALLPNLLIVGAVARIWCILF